MLNLIIIYYHVVLIVIYPGTESLLRAARSTLEVCKTANEQHHASQKEEDDAREALQEAEEMVRTLGDKYADERVKRNRAVMDYDHVVKMLPGIKLVRGVDPEADFCIAKVLCYEPGFGERLKIFNI